MIFAAAVITASAIFIYGGSFQRLQVVVQGEDGQQWQFPLDAHEILTVKGPLGATLVELHDGAARITASPCTNKTCIAAGAVHAAGHFAACLPNRVIVTVMGAPAAGRMDAVVW